jgi:hypothetical protein
MAPPNQAEMNRLLFRNAGPKKYKTYISADIKHIIPANRLIPPSTPNLSNNGRENKTAPPARLLLAAALAAKREAAYFGYIFGM